MQKRKLKNIHLSKLITFFIIIAFVLAIGKLIYISLARNIDGIDLKNMLKKEIRLRKYYMLIVELSMIVVVIIWLRLLIHIP